VTRQQVLAAARELFAARGIERVSVREIAAAASVNHALVHRYLGTKRDIVGEILRREVQEIAAVTGPDEVADPMEATERARSALRYLLGDGRSTTLLVLRAELDGLAPERLMEGDPVPLHLLSDSLVRFAGAEHGDEARVVAAVVGAAVLGLAAAGPLLLAGTHLDDRDPAEVLDRCVDLLVGLLAATMHQ
jgi:AcrR family transcriptional regulator